MINEKNYHVKIIAKKISVRVENINNKVTEVKRQEKLIQLKELEILDNEEEL